MRRPLSLRARLVLGVVLVTTAGTAAGGVATYTSLRAFLFERTDESLADAHRGLAPYLHHGCPGAFGVPAGGTRPGDFVQIRSADGRIRCSAHIPRLSEPAAPPPRLPATIEPVAGAPGRYFTAPSEGGEGRYRVRVGREPLTQGTVLLATPLTDVDATLRRLLLIELLVAAAVLAALAALGLWVVRVGLRPLREIETTAAAIAAGDLTRRVGRAEPRTEVGRLGLALNAMLGHIESALNARAATEQKLRRFVADASHELRTPLAAVRAYAELFPRGADRRPRDLARAMAGITRESKRMSALVDDLLLLARLDEGRPLEQEPVELDDVVRDAVDAAAAVEPERPVEVDVERVVVIGDADRLRQIVDNSLGNVRPHTPRGPPLSVRVDS